MIVITSLNIVFAVK